MQITLVQTELEQAIREYVGRQFVLAPGNSMSIELTATRGTDGFKATIDIIPVAVPTPILNPSLVPVATKAPTPLLIQQQQPFVPPTPPAPVEEIVQPQAETVELADGAESGPTSGDHEGSEATDSAGSASTPQARSLFGKMTRPKN